MKTKTQNRKSKRRIERYALADIIGSRRGGFFDGHAAEIRDLVPQNGSFRVRNGTVEAFSFGSPVLFTGSTNNNGSITGYASVGSRLYELPGPSELGDVGEARYISSAEITREGTFLFTSGGSTYMATGGSLCKREDTDFEDFSDFSVIFDVKSDGGVISHADCIRATNLFDGRMTVRIRIEEETDEMRFEWMPIAIEGVTVEGVDEVDYTAIDGRITFSGMLVPGDVVYVTARYAESSLVGLGLIGASEELDGCTYLYSRSALYEVRTVDGALFCQGPVLSLPEGGLKRAFVCSGTLVLAIGEGLCVFDSVDRTLRIIESHGARDASCICSCGGEAYVASDGYLTRLSISQSGEREALHTVVMKDCFDYGRLGRVLGMAYSRADRCLWMLVEAEGERRIFVLEAESGVWFEVTCFDSPDAVVECEGSIAVICSGKVYYSASELIGDTRGDEILPITGTVSFNPQDMGDPFIKKRINSLAVKVSSCVTGVSAEIVTDRGRRFYESRSIEYGNPALELFDPQTGIFGYAAIKVSVTGFESAALCSVELDVRSA